MIFRYARHTRDIRPLTDFYTQVIGLEVIGQFGDHGGIDGVLLGKPGSPWHLEFTQSADLPEHAFDDEDNLVFYPETTKEWLAILHQIEVLSIPLVEPRNRYWIDHGFMILDPDGYRVVISKQRITLK